MEPSQLITLQKGEEARYIRFRTLSSYAGGRGISRISIFAERGVRYLLPLFYPIDAIKSMWRSNNHPDAFTGTVQLQDVQSSPSTLVSRMLTYGGTPPAFPHSLFSS